MILTADYYDISNNYYYRALASLYKSQRLRIDFLDHQENTLYRVEQDIDSSDAGKIVNNNSQGTRRSFSFNLINVDNIYNILDENTFWFNRKFRVYLGIAYQDDTFWFSKGVYITQNATLDSVTKTVSLNGVDKYAQLDGTLNVLQADEIDTVFEVGSKISNVIHDILMMDIGNGMVLDPIEPIIDPDIGNQKLYKEFTMSAGSYYGDFLTEIMTSFGCDIFYDTLGRLTVRRVFNDDRPYWYAFKSPAYNFKDEVWGFQSPQITIDMKGVNKITVSTENVNYPNVSETVINNNPRSPLCASKIGRRTFTENGGIIYISLGDETIDTPETKCREYAEYRLMQETCLALEASFQTPPLYHLCEGDVITITDSALGFDQEPFLINSITISTGTDSMSVTATNLKYLPTDIYNDAIYTYIFRSPSHPSYTLSYSLNGGSGTTPSSLVTKISCPFTPATGYDKSTHVNTFNAPSNSDLKSWTGSNSFEYEIGKTYTKPMSDLTLYANYVGCASGVTSVVPTSAISNKTISRLLSSRGSHYIEAINASGKTYYFKGRGQDNDSFTLSFSPNATIKHYTDSTHLTESSPAQLLSDIDGGSYTTATFPSQLETLSFVEYPLEASVTGTINFPANLSLLRYSGDFLGGDYSSPASIALTNACDRIYEGTDGSSMLSNNTTLHTLTSPLKVTVKGKGSNGTLFASRVPLSSVQLQYRPLVIENANVLNYAQHMPASETYQSGDGWDRIPSSAVHRYNNVVIAEKGSIYCGDTYHDSTTDTDVIVGHSNVTVRVDDTLALGNIDDEPVAVGAIRAFNYASTGQLSIGNKIEINNVCTAFTDMEYNYSSTLQLPLTQMTRPGNCFNNISHVSTLVFGGIAITSNLDGGDVDSVVACNNPDLRTLVFTTSADFNCSDGDGNIRLACDNPNLTEVIFSLGTLTFSVDGNGTYDIFKNNNANFKVTFMNGASIDPNLIAYLDNNNIPYQYS